MPRAAGLPLRRPLEAVAAAVAVVVAPPSNFGVAGRSSRWRAQWRVVAGAGAAPAS